MLNRPRMFLASLALGSATALVGQALPASSVVPGANGKIAFASSRTGGILQIYTANADGSSQVPLTANASTSRRPSWSPDGSKIAFDTNRDGHFEVYTMNADGTGQTRLTASPNSKDDFDPSWSPDGSKVAFVSFRDFNQEIYSTSLDGSAVVRLTNNTSSDAEPEWSPDGSKIAFTSLRDGGSGEVYTMNADGTSQTRLTTTNGNFSPSWSPDGSKIAFVSRRDGASSNEIYSMNADGTSQTRLTTTNGNFSPSWSPDGSKIAFTSLRDGPTGEIYSMNADGTSQTRLTTVTGDDIDPAWGWGGAPPAPTLPTAPAAPTATAGNAQAVVTWADPSSFGNGTWSKWEVATADDTVVATVTAQSAHTATVSGLTNGTAYQFRVRAVTGNGNGPYSDLSAAVTPATPPDTTPPVASMSEPSATFTLATTTPVRWSGTDSGSGTKAYNVRWKRAANGTDFGAYVAFALGTTSTSTTSSVGEGYTNCYQAQAIDNADNKSAWTAARCIARPLDDAHLTFGTGWTASSSTAYYSGTAHSTTKLGASLSRANVHLRRVGIVATRCATCGQVAIYVGSTRIGGLNLANSTTSNKVVLMLPPFSAKIGTVTVRVTSSGKLVRIDGLATSNG